MIRRVPGARRSIRLPLQWCNLAVVLSSAPTHLGIRGTIDSLLEVVALTTLGRCDHTLHGARAHYAWDNSLDPALEVAPGCSVEFEVVEATGGQLGRTSRVEDVARLDFTRVNPVTGPVFVQGARPGDVLVVEILEFGVSDWGWSAIIPGFGLLAEEYPDPFLKIWEFDGSTRSAPFNALIDIPIHPFPGTVGVAPAEAGAHSVVPPRNCGGNMDIRHLTAGTTLLLPIQVEGALFSIGDTHAAQGDGEVCGTAIESPMRVALRFDVRQDFSIDAPQYLIPGPLLTGCDPKGYYVTTGIDDDLMEAARKSVRAMIVHLSDGYGLSREEAYVLASVAVDLKISEVVDAPNWVVSAFLPQSIFRA